MIDTQFPKMIYRDGENRVVNSQSELDACLAKGFTLDPGSVGSKLTIEQVRAKVNFYIEKFEKWNEILKQMELEVEEPEVEKFETGTDAIMLDGRLVPTPEGGAAEPSPLETAKAKPAPAKRPVAKKPAKGKVRKPAKKAAEKAPAAQPVQDPAPEV